MRTVFFDFGGTLARTWVSEGHQPGEFWEPVLAEHGVAVEPARIRAAIEETDREFDGRLYAYLGRTPEFWKEYDGRIR